MLDESPNDITPTTGLDRRGMLRTAGLGALAVGATLAARSVPAQAQTITDTDILNFALNLEYLEAEYYVHAVNGVGLAQQNVSGPAQGGVTGGSKVPFQTVAFHEYANEIAQDEMNHVIFLRSALGSAAVGAPAIDIQNSFTALGQIAGLGSNFNPYADEVSFLIGAYVFEDVGVTAYNGAAPLIQNKGILAAAASILAVEAYHASEIRTRLLNMGYGFATNQISAVRASLSGAADDQGVVVNQTINVVPTDSNGLAFSRTTRQVLNIVYGGVNAYSGLFFPYGMNGTIR